MGSCKGPSGKERCSDNINSSNTTGPHTHNNNIHSMS